LLGLTLHNSAFGPHRVFTCSVWPSTNHIQGDSGGKVNILGDMPASFSTGYSLFTAWRRTIGVSVLTDVHATLGPGKELDFQP
jgi:hypothetical protein